VATLVVALHAISRAGRPVLASWILVIGLSVIVTQRAWITGGIHAPVPVFYALFIVMGGLLIGARGGFVTAAVCLLGAIVLTIGTATGTLARKPGAGSPLAAFVFVALGIGLAMLVQALIARRPRPEDLGTDAVSMLVHDMRAPMQITQAHLELLRQDLSGEQLKDVDGALGGVKTLHLMANSLLDVSRLEAGRMPIRRMMTDVAELATEEVRALNVLQSARTMTVETVGDPICNCDPELTRRIVENLLTNAMKHTDVVTPIRVTVIGSVRNRISIAVSDTGPGVPKQNRPGLFERFSAQGPRRAAGFESSGLGLAFCRLAAEAQGGRVRYEPGSPEGSVFTLDLPR
jgi:signal transduction histidine kinase